jgi:hypothetical protein
VGGVERFAQRGRLDDLGWSPSLLKICGKPSQRRNLQHHGLHVPCLVPHARDL